MQENITFVDLGFHSGTLWAAENSAIHGKTHVTFLEALNYFGKQIPTRGQFHELKNYCDWKWLPERKGYLVTSRINGNSIFLGATGYRYGDSLRACEKSGLFWSRTESIPPFAYYLVFSGAAGFNIRDGHRDGGYAVRLIKNTKQVLDI